MPAWTPGAGRRAGHFAARQLHGHLIDLGDALRKGTKMARFSLVTHRCGFELRLLTADLTRSQVCGNRKVLDTHERWKVPMIEKEWL
jgi:hypothetical protein